MSNKGLQAGVNPNLADDDDIVHLGIRVDYSDPKPSTPESRREHRMMRWPAMIDNSQWKYMTDNWYGAHINDYVNDKLRNKPNVMLPKLSAKAEDDPDAVRFVTDLNDPKLLAAIKAKLEEASGKDNAVIPILVNAGGHFVTYMVHKQQGDVFVRAMDGLNPSSPKENGVINNLVKSVFPNATFERSNTTIQFDYSSCGPIMLLVTELSINNPTTSAEQVVQLAQNYLRELAQIPENASEDQIKASFQEAMLLVRKQQAFSVLTPEDQAKLRKGEPLPSMDKITTQDIERFERAFKKCVSEPLHLNNVNTAPIISENIGLTDVQKSSEIHKVELARMLIGVGVKVENGFDHLKINIPALKQAIGDNGYESFVSLLKSVEQNPQYPAFKVEENTIKFYDVDIEALMTNLQKKQDLNNLCVPMSREQSPQLAQSPDHIAPPAPVAAAAQQASVTQGGQSNRSQGEPDDIDTLLEVSHLPPVRHSQPPPQNQVVIDNVTQFKDIVNKLATMVNDPQAKAQYDITKIDLSKSEDPNPRITLEIANHANVPKRAYIAPAPEGGVVYSIDSSLSNNDSAKVIQNLVQFEVDNAKPGTPLTIPKGPHEKIVEDALIRAIEAKYGSNTCKIENGKCTIPTTPPLEKKTQNILSVGKSNH